MKKTPDTGASKSKPSKADGTRARILAAARLRFSQDVYENVGTRDIATDAGVDAALVSRYFGSKEKLFAEAIEGAFHLEDHIGETLDQLGKHLAEQVMDDVDERLDGEFDALGLMLRAAGSATTAGMVSARFHAEFVTPLANMLRGRDKEVRAAMIASYVIGLATMRHALRSPLLDGVAQRRAVGLAGATLQVWIDGESKR